MIRSLVVSLLLTLVIELAVSLILGVRDKNDILVIALANIITNPVAVYIYGCISKYSSAIMIMIGTVILIETAVVIIEYLIFKRYLSLKRINPFLFSFIINALSFFIGMIITRFI